MPTIFNTLKRPNGSPIRGALVQVSLSWDTDEAVAVSYDAATPEFFVDDVSTAYTDVDGYWSMELVYNSDLSPTSVYKVVETIDSSNVNAYYVDLSEPATPQSSYWVGDLIVVTPDWEED